MAIELKMPKMGLTMTSGTVGKWLKKEGESVSKGEPVAEVMTDKITNVLEAPADGTLIKIIVPEGGETEPSAVIGYLGEAGEQVAAPAAAAPNAGASPAAAAPAVPAAAQGTPEAGLKGGERIFITPLARKVAREHGIDWANISGTGPGGRIIRKDIDAAIARGVQAAPSAAAPEAAVLERIPYSGMRMAIGRNMSASWTSIPRVTHHTSTVADNLMQLRAQLNASRSKEERFTVTDLLLKITATALQRYPLPNSIFTGDEILVMKDVNLGFAVAVGSGLTDRSLIVPVIKKADQKSLSEIRRERVRLVESVMNNDFTPEDVTGGTFTLTNVGATGSVDHFNPIINAPEVAILGVGRMLEKPVAEDGEVVVRKVMGFSLTHDHRAIDGAVAAEFLAIFNDIILNPMNGIV